MLGWRNLGFAFRERDTNPMVHTHSGFATHMFCIPRTRHEPFGTYSGFAKRRFCIPNDIQTLWRTLILGWLNLSFASPERDANPMTHISAGLAKPRFCIPRTRCEPYGAHSFWVGETSVLHSQNEMRTLWPILILGLARLKFGIPSTRCEPYGAYSFRLARLKLGIPTTRCEPYGAYSCWVCEI